MTSSDPQIELWNGPSGNRWADFFALTDRAFGVFGEAALARLACQPGERVLDIGCGAGTSVLQLAESVGAKGAVLGIDASAPLVATAHERCAHLPQATVTCADAASINFDQAWDAVYSNLGVMFFADPAAALDNLRSALRPGGRMVFTCWQDADRNHWCSHLLDAILPLVDERPESPAPRTPGTFAFADPAYVHEFMTLAGFQDVTIDDLCLPVPMGRSVQEATDFALGIGPAASLTEKQAPEVRTQIKARLAELFKEAQSGDMVTLAGAAWIVSATAP